MAKPMAGVAENVNRWLKIITFIRVSEYCNKIDRQIVRLLLPPPYVDKHFHSQQEIHQTIVVFLLVLFVRWVISSEEQKQHK